jgi:hypothetical protein
MAKDNKTIVFILTLLLAVVLQVVFIAADTSETPSRVAVKFSKAFYKLNPAVSDYLCNKTAQNEDGNFFDLHLNNAAQTAHSRGFSTSFMKSTLYAIETHTTKIADDKARVMLEGKTRISVCPFFVWVAQIFHLGETYSVAATIDVIKEDGKWRVCGNPLSIPHI